MPMATGMAGVNMRLVAGAVRELHWHKTAEVRASPFTTLRDVQLTFDTHIVGIRPQGQRHRHCCQLGWSEFR